jgi:hypothetical protein
MSPLPSVVYWEDPVQSGAIFGSILIGLIALASCSLITVCSYSCLCLLSLVILVKFYSFVMVKAGKAEAGSDPLAKVSTFPLAVPADKVSSVAPCLAGTMNCTVAELRRLFLVESMVDTIKFGLSLWLLTYVGAWFNALTLVIVAWVGLFTIPKVYINNQAKVDEVLGKVMAQVQEIKEKVVALIPIKGGEKKE